MIREMNLGMGYWTVNYTVYKITNHFFCKRGNFVHQHWGCTNVSCIVVSLKIRGSKPKTCCVD